MTQHISLATQFAGADFGWVAVMVIAVVLIVAFVVLQCLHHRRRITEARLKTAEALAKQGALDDAHLRELLTPPKSGRRLIYFVAWVLMLAGIYCFIMMNFMPFDARSYFMAGMLMTFVSTSIFATPFMFRELEKQGWI